MIRAIDTVCFLGGVAALLLVCGCPVAPEPGRVSSNGPDPIETNPIETDPVVDPQVPVASSCGSAAFACYDAMPTVGLNLARFRPTARWTKTTLTWRLTNTLTDLDADAQRAAVRSALALWSAASPLTFTEVGADAPSDLTISFERENVQGRGPFDGPGGFLGRAFFPGTGRAGDVELCADERWVVADAYLHGAGHDESGVWRPDLRMYRRDFVSRSDSHVYHVIEVQPCRPRPWQRDSDLREAAAKLGIGLTETGEVLT